MLKNLPSDIVPISICAKPPYWYKGLQYKKLAPTYDILQNWHQERNKEVYKRHFKNQVLHKLHVYEIIEDLKKLSKGKDIALICYEKPGEFCHRKLVAEWLNSLYAKDRVQEWSPEKRK